MSNRTVVKGLSGETIAQYVTRLSGSGGQRNVKWKSVGTKYPSNPRWTYAGFSTEAELHTIMRQMHPRWRFFEAWEHPHPNRDGPFYEAEFVRGAADK